MTLLNKSAFSKVDFHYPYLLSALHMFCNSVGSKVIFKLINSVNKVKLITNEHQRLLLSEEDGISSDNQTDTPEIGMCTALEAKAGQSIVGILGEIDRKSIDTRAKTLKMLGFSIIFSLNIAIGNVSLRHVSVNFNQVMRSLVPALTIVMGALLGRYTSIRRKLAVIPIVMGVACACYGDMLYTSIGLVYTSLCVILAAFKVVAAGEMLTGDIKLHPVDLLSHMAPLALVQCLILSVTTGEMSTFLSKPMLPASHMAIVIGSGVASFTLNISSLQANKVTSPLTLCIAANVKQVTMIALATIIFSTPITPMNATGIIIVLCGSSIYSYISVLEKIQPSQEAKELTGKVRLPI